ncbi:phenylacetic acid degradation-related protein [Emticicia oligotrophica DSM 17448]|uniref:Phenylacetic acid degradation-related protein n=1 Tax=Emticicia oligotrophica (strain DSM 17448 / CIP 109782 / MTCC 6937 / GPTSA100-15) TaxID=929562 RepID=A0ABM5MZT0_EMTOG|nr:MULTISPECIES: PaaI family thioesterase [Emticicia]AFK02598.1 phenylacetic acid degradation-related protein [Emticicia oligotrophica DSM 17448]
MNHALEFFKQHIGKNASEVSPSPLGRWLNGKLISAEEGSLIVEFTVREEMTNPGRILHGGTMASMLDDVMGMTVFSLGKENFYSTINLNVDYLLPAQVGESIFVKSKIIRAGKTVVNVVCEARNAQQKLLAQCSSNLVATSIKV